MIQIFYKTLKERRSTIIAYCLVALGLLLLYVSMFPALADQAKQFQDVIKAYPQSFLKAFGIDSSAMFFSSLENFLAAEQFSFTWPLLVAIMMISIAGSSIAGEIEAGTIEFVLSKPISRIKIFLGKYLAGLSGLILFVIFSVLASIPLAAAFSINLHSMNVLATVLLGFLFSLSVYSISFMLSAILSEKGKVYFLMGAVLVVMYVLNLLARIRDSLVNLQYLSFFHYFDQNKTLVKNELDAQAIIVLLAISVASVAIGLIYFSKRDITI